MSEIHLDLRNILHITAHTTIPTVINRAMLVGWNDTTRLAGE